MADALDSKGKRRHASYVSLTLVMPGTSEEFTAAIDL